MQFRPECARLIVPTTCTSRLRTALIVGVCLTSFVWIGSTYAQTAGESSSIAPRAAANLVASPTREGEEFKGYNCVFLGHSFFAPIARALQDHPAQAGFDAHEQMIVFHGGANGSPGRLWASDKEDVRRAKEQIRTGDVDLIGLTFFPGVGSELADYQKWIDLGTEHNPDAKFFIMAPWPRYQDRSFEEYEAQWERFHPAIHDIIDELEAANPDTELFCIPQGKWMVELWRLYENDELPDVAVLKRPGRDNKQSCLFVDQLGHGGRIPVELGALLWLTAIYDVDVREYDLDTETKADLKELAWKIIHEHNDAHVEMAK